MPWDIVVIEHGHVVKFGQTDLCLTMRFVNMSEYMNFWLIDFDSLSQMFRSDVFVSIFDGIQDTKRRLMGD